MSTISVSAQVGIGVETSNINASAQLEVASTTKGFLAPRMTSAQKEAISAPAVGLLVYQTDGTPGFYYFNGTIWVFSIGEKGLTGDNGTPTTVGAVGTATANAASITAGVLSLSPADGTNPGIVTTTAQNFAGTKTFSSDAVVNGVNIGKGNGSGYGNTAIGTDVLKVNSGGVLNTAYGSNVLEKNTSGGFNTAQGHSALSNNTTGGFNIAIGQSSMSSNTEGGRNTAIGTGSMSTNTIGTYNTTIGIGADVLANNLTNATAIGGLAKVNASNTIQLGNTAVIAVKTNGQLTTGAVTYPNTDGTANQVLTTDGAGNATWQAAAGISVGAVGTATANAASITAGVLSLSPADETNPGIVTTAAQTISGAKTFTDKIKMGAVTYPNTDGNADQVLTTDGVGNATWASAAVGSSVTVGTVGAATSNGATITTGVLSLSPADGTNPGIVTTGTQTIAGAKTFTDKIKMGVVTYPNTDGTANQVLTTDGAGNATWAAGGGGGSITVGPVGFATANGATITNSLLSLAPASASFPGIVTTGAQTIAGAKTFANNDGLFATGTYGASGTNLTLAGSGTRMIWYAKKAAFRVGFVSSSQWNDGNIGAFSYATGHSTKANGNFSTAMGYNTTSSGQYSTALGDSTIASGDASNTLGYASKARSYAETVIGMNNADYTPSSTTVYAATDRLFVIGNGSGLYYDTNIDGEAYNKSNALVMLKNGNTTFSGTVTAASYTTNSDIRLKKNITPLKQSIAAVMELNPVSYEKKQNLTSNDYSIKENGFIAQELQKVMPTLVTEGTDKDKLLSVNYTTLIPVLTKAIQEQQEQLSTQKKEIETLKAMVEQLINKK